MSKEQQPRFLAQVRRLIVRDPLAELLGAADEGTLEYRYEDAVRLAGHSCPTVASTYMLSWHALSALYPNELPERGAIRASFREPPAAGVTGVVASIVTLLTGAASEGGFKGLAGRFGRRGLLDFGVTQPLAIRFTRLDDGTSVDAQADLSSIPGDPAMPELMARSLQPGCDQATRSAFARLWQERVRKVLLDHGDDREVYRIARC